MDSSFFQSRASHPPVSNADRQRQFRERNPGYYNKYNRRRPSCKRAKAAREARFAALRAAELAAETTAQPMLDTVTLDPMVLETVVLAPGVVTMPIPTVRLALPAPVVDPMMLALSALAEQLAKARALQPIPPSTSRAA